MRPWLRVGSWLAALISLSYFGFIVWLGIKELEELEVVASWRALGATTLLGLGWIVFLERYWAQILNDSTDAPIPSRASVRWIFAKSYLARYAPGKVWPIMIRTADLDAQGVHWKITIRAILIEQSGFMVGSILAFLATVALLSAILANSHPYLIVFSVILAVLLYWAILQFLFSATIASLFSNQLRRLASRISSESLENIQLPSRGEWSRAALLGTLLAIAQSIVALPLALEFAPDSGPLVLLVACLAYPAARWIGQMIGVSPGGLGIREGAFIAFLAPILPASITLLIAVWLRAGTILAEGLFLAGAAMASVARLRVNM